MTCFAFLHTDPTTDIKTSLGVHIARRHVARRSMETEKVAEGAAAAAEEIVVEAASTAMQLKPIHIIVMVITLLHAVAIGMWFLVYMGGTKGTLLAHGVCVL